MSILGNIKGDWGLKQATKIGIKSYEYFHGIKLS
jgi:hypothetical protein